MAGYRNIHSGGVAPILELALPGGDRARFKAFAMRLLEGPPLDESLIFTMTMVVLLRQSEVEEMYPDHRLILAVRSVSREMNISTELLQTWTIAIAKSWKDVNEHSLSIAQVSSIIISVLR